MPVFNEYIRCFRNSELIYIDNSLATFQLNTKTKVVSDPSVNKTPADYVIGSWHKDFKDDQLKRYNVWTSSGELPTLKDFLNDKIWNE